jgi:replicative DNA helicase
MNIDGERSGIDIIARPQNEPLLTIDDIVDQLSDNLKRREFLGLLEKTKQRTETIARLSPEEVEEIRKDLYDAEIAIGTSGGKKSILNMTEWFSDYETELDKRKRGKQYSFYDFAFDSLIPDGPRPGEIGLIVSSSGSGKSTVALNLISNLVDAEVPCMYFSLEMSSISTMDRLCSKRIGIPYKDITNPKEQNEFEGVINAIMTEKEKLVKNTKFRFSEDATVSIADLYQYIRKFQADIGQSYCVVVVDLLSMITDFCKNSSNMAQQIEISINKLSAMVKELGIHLIGILQYNRSSEADSGKIRDWSDLQRFRPNRAQIKNSGSWLERARYTISTFRALYYAKQYLEEDDYIDKIDVIEIMVTKFNNGELKKIEALFDGPTFNVSPIEDSLATAQTD